MKTICGLLLAVAMAALVSADALAQAPPVRIAPNPDSPIGARNPKGPAELQQLEFLIGDWKVDIVLHRPGGDMAYEARWHNIWIVDGTAIMQEWRDAFSTGAEIRTYNRRKGKWEGHNFYTGFDSWTEGEGSFANGEFVIDTETAGPNGPILNRERYYDITPNSFRMVATQSSDGGKTWSSPTYEMTCTRIS